MDKNLTDDDDDNPTIYVDAARGGIVFTDCSFAAPDDEAPDDDG